MINKKIEDLIAATKFTEVPQYNGYTLVTYTPVHHYDELGIPKNIDGMDHTRDYKLEFIPPD